MNECVNGWMDERDGRISLLHFIFCPSFNDDIFSLREIRISEAQTSVRKRGNVSILPSVGWNFYLLLIHHLKAAAFLPPPFFPIFSLLRSILSSFEEFRSQTLPSPSWRLSGFLSRAVIWDYPVLLFGVVRSLKSTLSVFRHGQFSASAETSHTQETPRCAEHRKGKDPDDHDDDDESTKTQHIERTQLIPISIPPVRCCLCLRFWGFPGLCSCE